MAFISSTTKSPVSIGAQSLRASTFVSTSTKRWTLHRARRVSSRPILARPNAPSMQVVDVKKHEVFMPALSSTMTEGRVVQWLKQPGDAVDVGEPIMVVESDKADMDVESFEKGFLASILVEEGDSAPVGDTVGIIVERKEDIDKVTSSAAPAKPAPAAAAPAPPAAPAAAPAASPPTATAKPDLLEVFMPALSSTMTEGKVVEWMKSEGDSVENGEIVMVVESDKADMDVESFESGIIAHIAVDAGESCPVGEPVAYIAKTQADVAAIKAWAASENGAASVDVPVAAAAAESSAAVSESGDTAAPARRIVSDGRIIASPLAKRVAAEASVDLHTVVGTGENGRIVEADVKKAICEGGSTSGAVESVKVGKVIATPEAKKIAKKEKIDINSVQGTGNFGRVTGDDVLRAAGKGAVTAVGAAAAAAAAAAAPAVAPATTASGARGSDSGSGKDSLKKTGAVAMNAMQKAVVGNMNASLSVPVFRVSYKIKTGAFDELYSKLKPKGVTVSAMLAKAVGIVLSKHAIMNAQYVDGNSILYREDINVAMAVALKDGGLITPTLQNADSTDIYSLSRTWKDLVSRAMSKKLSVEEYSSGTFFISNLGMYGVEQFDAILPPGAPGILAIGASKATVGMMESGLIGAYKEMTVTLTADHRHIYGADGASFLRELKTLLEEDVMQLVL